MISDRFEKDSAEFKFFADLYKFAAMFYNLEGKEEWEKMTKTAEELVVKYKGTTAGRLCRHMVIAFIRVKSKELELSIKAGNREGL